MDRPLANQQTARIDAAWIIPVAAIVFVCYLAAELLGTRNGIKASELLGDYADKSIGFAVLLIPTLPTFILFRAWLSGARSPIRFIRDLVRRRVQDGWQFAGLLAPFLLMPLLFTAYGVLKMIMPVLRPFEWDAMLATADRALFLGQQPWMLSHAVLDDPAITLVLDRLYSLWVVLLSVAVTGFALFATPATRARFFLSFTITWIVLGLGGGYLLSSAGPCFAPLIGADAEGEFAALRASLAQLGADGGFRVNALHWQETLWTAHVSRDYDFAMGISAMPSMHNAIAVLYALALSRCHIAVRALAWLFAAFVFVGSVHLGWHYAADGIVSALAVVIIWTAVDRYLTACAEPGRGSGRM